MKNQVSEKQFHPLIEPSVYSREALPSRVSILNQVMDALVDPRFNKIGIYGIGGVGKTTLVKEVHRKAVEDNLFDSVVMVAVSQTPDLKRIKEEIADSMGQEVSPAYRTSNMRWMFVNSKVLIILDDIRTNFDLKSLGIPSNDESERCKILLTSRMKDVLSYEMGTQKDFLLAILSEDEAKSLFEMTIGEAENTELQAVANEVVEKCVGLPLLIILVATYLKNRNLSAWRDTSKNLFDFGDEELHERVHKVLSSIIENLPSNEVKSFFLLCTLFGESNIPINHLLTYAMGLDLFRNINNMQDVRERLFRMTEKLKVESLLLDGDMNGYVKMHDVVLDVARSIAIKEEHAFSGISGHGLKEWPSKDCTRISLSYSDIDEFHEGLQYPKAELFSLFSKYLYLEIPNLSFDGFRELRVLNLTGIHFMFLPSSLHFLTNLNSLCLHHCKLHNVAIIGELKQLEFLSFADSSIVELPKQMGQLNQLKLLDLTNCTQLKVFPANSLSKLSFLEELYMCNSFVRWDVKGNISVMELEELRHLTTLEIQVMDAKKLSNCVFSIQLQRYKMCIGDELYWGEEHGSSRWLKLRLKASIHMEHGLKKLLRGTEALYLYEVRGIKNWLYDLDGKGSHLKHLHIQKDDLIQHIINSRMWDFCHTFPTLETLSLNELNNLEEICHGQLTIHSFCKLRILIVILCHKLRNLFSYSSTKCLPQLQKINVSYCNKIETIIGKGSEDKVMELSQLSSLRLSYLYQLRSIFDTKVFCPNLTSLIIKKCGRLKYIFKTSIVKSLLQLKKLVIQNCYFVEEIIFKEKSINKIVFPNLNFLRLDDLPNLKRFSSCNFIEFRSLKEMEIIKCQRFRGNNCNISSIFNDMVTFSNLHRMRIYNMASLEHLWDNQNLKSVEASFQNLTTLHVVDFDKLENLVTPSIAKTMVHLMELRITHCEVMKEIVANNGDNPEHEIIFNCLKVLELRCLPTLNSFCSANYAFHFPILKEVIVEKCLRMKIFSDGVLSTPKLQGVRHWKNEEKVQYWEGNLNATIASQCFRKRVLQNADKWYMIEDSSSPKVILSSQLQFLNMLKKIKVSDCDSARIVFDMEDVSVEYVNAGLLPQLEELQLINLPKLSELWNKDPVRMFAFRNLRLLKVQNCSSLKYVFTQSMTSSLIELEEINIENCMMMESIIKEEEAEEIEIPKITLPSMRKISINCCPRMKEFMSPLLSREQNPTPDEEAIREQKLYEIAMPMLEELRIDFHIIKHKLNGNNQPNFFSKLKVVELVFLSNSFPTTEKLVLRDSLVEEIIIHGLDDHYASSPWLEKIILSKLPKLKHVVDDYDPGRVFVFKNLQVLQVWKCDRLEILVPSSVSFQNLTFLQVSTCNRLINLITVSTAKSLVQLKTMYVGRCKRLREILKLELDGEESEIGFNRLEYLVLDDLPCLTRFCSGKNIFNFPYLKEVFIIKCPNMKMFAQAINIPKLSQVQTGSKEYEWEWKGSLNSTIKHCLWRRNRCLK